MKKKFLAVYDYGMGGLWFMFMANSPKQITDKYPFLKAFAEFPDFFPDEEIARIEQDHLHDIDDEPTEQFRRMAREVGQRE